MISLIRRFSFAWNAFRDAPPEEYLIVEEVRPLGWCVLNRFGNYSDADSYRRSAQYGEGTRVMTEADWRRRTISTMRRRATWHALAKLTHDLDVAQRELEDERRIKRVQVLDDYARSRSL